MLDWLAHVMRPAPSPWLPYLGVVGTVVGTFMGWGLGFWSRLYFERRDAKKYRDAIYVELVDVHSALKTRLEGVRRAFAEFLRDREITALPSEIGFPIYEKWFAEVMLQFTESERLRVHPVDELIPAHSRAVFPALLTLAPNQACLCEDAIASEGAVVLVNLEFDTISFDVHVHFEGLDADLHCSPLK
jgi:hypothetical protein